MSTRRARIKAVTSLPPRRKNADKSGNKADNLEKLQVPTNKDIIDKHNTSEIIAYETGDIIKPQEVSHQRNAAIDDIKSPKARVANTVSVIKNVFISPQKKSPRKTFATPIAPSPKHPKLQDVHKIVTQKNVGTPVTQKINYCDELQISNSFINKVVHTEDIHKKANTARTLNNDDEAVMDGIVPLQPENHASKSIDLLKNDITSENVEGLFDPIIPLPSPSKVRPKLKPVPRLGPHRRNSIQGSASESEDESRRGLASAGPNTPAPRQRYDSHTSISTLQSLPNRDVSRVRNDSICSTTSQATTVQVPASPVREKPAAKKRPEVNRRMMASKRRRETVKREALTMYDLIFYNPSSNPIVPDEDELKVIEENEKELNNKEEKEEERPPSPQESTPVPQIKLGPNGEIMLDETSLVIKRTESRPLAGVVREGGWRAGGGRYRRAPRSADWEPAETVRFYRSLGALGTDFTLMAPLFPNRTRKELKMKFKKEEKLNGAQVDKALRSATGWDIGRLKEEFTAERREAHESALRERERLQLQRRAERTRTQDARTVRVRTSRASKAMESTMLPGVSKQTAKGVSVVTAEDIVEKVQTQKSIPTTPSSDNFATLTLIKKQRANKTPNQEALSSVGTPDRVTLDQIPVPANIETGSLVVLTVNDPSSPGKKMLQTYIAHGPHKLTPVALPATFLNSVVGYMKKNAIKGSSTASSPLMSPNSVTSHDSKASASGAFQSPVQRKRHSSYNITQL